MKKILMILLLAALALSCLVAAGIAGFYGYRQYSKRKAAVTGPVLTDGSDPSGTAVANGAEPHSANPEAGSADGATGPAAPDLPQVYGQTRRSANSGEPSPPPSPGGAAQSPRGSSTQQPSPAAVPPQPQAPPAGTSRGVPQSPLSSTELQPDNKTGREGWRLKSGSAAPYSQTRRSGSGTPSQPEAAKPARPPKGGSLGFIFESRVDRGEMVLRVDGEIMEQVPFQASADTKFRFTRQIPLAPGTHRVKVRINLPREEPLVREWDIGVTSSGSTVWKATLDRFPKQLEVKNIP